MTTRNMKTVVPSPNLIIRKMVLLALLLPPSYQPLLAAENAPEWVYSVRPKDTLIHFAKRHLINPQDWRSPATIKSNSKSIPHTNCQQITCTFVLA